MNRARTLLLLLTLSHISGCISAASQHPGAQSSVQDETLSTVDRDFGSHFGELKGAFVLLDPQKKTILAHNSDRARTRFIPASTFKIPNTLIALESGVATGPDFPLEWNSELAPRQPWWPESWARDHTLRSALTNSAVWYYQELARRIGPERMASYLEQFEYGNRDLSGGIDRFWLSGGLAISPEEQVEFLRKFYFGELGVSDESTRIVKEILVLETTPQYKLSGKTGWAALGEDSGLDVGWLVGYVERGEDVYFFATNIDIRTNADASARLKITKSILEDLGLLGD